MYAHVCVASTGKSNIDIIVELAWHRWGLMTIMFGTTGAEESLPSRHGQLHVCVRNCLLQIAPTELVSFPQLLSVNLAEQDMPSKTCLKLLSRSHCNHSAHTLHRM